MESIIILFLGFMTIFSFIRITAEICRGVKYVLYPKLKHAWIKTKPFLSWQTILRLILPRNAGTRRLCFFIGILLSAITMVKFHHYTNPGHIRRVCNGLKSCHQVGTPTWWMATITAFCVPFVIAKIIDFIIQGYNQTKEKK